MTRHCKRFSKDEDAILIAKYSNSNTLLLSKELNRNRQSIADRAIKLGLRQNKKYHINQWSDKEDEILIEYHNQLSANKISKNYLPNRSKSSIINRLQILKLNINSKDRHAKLRRQYIINDNYFSQYCDENCYWAGFFAADGSVDSRNGNALIFALSQKDLQTVQSFNTALSSNYPIYTNNKKEARLCFCSQQIKKDLKNNFNINPRKSYNLLPPPISEEYLIKCFMIGFIDGDGWISIKNNKYIKLGIFGTIDMMNWFAKYFNIWAPHQLYNKSIQQSNPYKKGNYYTYEISGNRALFLLREFNNIKIPKLNRKWNKLHSLKSKKVITYV